MRQSSAKGLVEEALTRSIIGAFYYVYNQLGYGFLEAVYAEALARTLKRRGHRVQREVRVLIYFDGEPLMRQRLDMVVDGRVIVELKSTHGLSLSTHRQLTSYVTNSEVQVGLLLHFGPRPEFHRVISTRRSHRHADNSGNSEYGGSTSQ